MTNQSSSDYGWVDDDGTVYVKTTDGERPVGQWPQGDPAAALAFYGRRFDGLVIEVGLLEQRIKAGALSPEDATSRVTKLRESISEAQAVGDLAGLAGRLDGFGPLIEQRRDARRAERAARSEESKQAKARIVQEAERLATGEDWRNGADRLRDLLGRWKVLPKSDKTNDEELWRRFSSARSTYTRRRRQHFAELDEGRDKARVTKEKLAAEADELSTSTDWSGTSRTYRDLMARWKAAGPASKEADEALWKRFRAAQDVFFGARDSVNAELDKEYAANANTKRRLLSEAEALLPTSNPRAAQEAFRDLAERWDATGKVPRSDVKELENRFKKVEQAVRGAEDDSWRRSNPEAHARASATISQLEASIAALRAEHDEAEQSGNERKARKASEAIEARQSWLDGARNALTDFTAD
ncbi:MAG: DUF349 domain-containing protein [Nocardioidaceae bacterium]